MRVVKPSRIRIQIQEHQIQRVMNYKCETSFVLCQYYQDRNKARWYSYRRSTRGGEKKYHASHPVPTYAPEFLPQGASRRLTIPPPPIQELYPQRKPPDDPSIIFRSV